MTTFYVDKTDPGASDLNDGSEGSPWLTVKWASLTMEAGDTTLIKGDGVTYTEDGAGADWFKAALTPAKSGTLGNPITFRGYTGHLVTVTSGLTGGVDDWPTVGAYQKNYIIWESVIIPKTVMWIDTIGCEVGHCELIGRLSGGGNNDCVHWEGSTKTRVHHCDIHESLSTSDHHNSAGVKIYTSTDWCIEDNYIHNNVTGIYPKVDASHGIIRRNYITDHKKFGVYATTRSDENEYYDNYVVNNKTVSSTSVDFYFGPNHVRDKVHDNIYHSWIGTDLGDVDDSTAVEIYNNVQTPGFTAWRQQWAYTGNEFEFFDNNVYVGEPIYQEGPGPTSHDMAWMQANGDELASSKNIPLASIYDVSWNLLPPYTTLGRFADAIGPGNGADGMIARMLDLSNYGPIVENPGVFLFVT